MEVLVAKVAEALVADVVEAVRKHESYRQLVESLAQQSLAAAASQAAGPTSGA